MILHAHKRAMPPSGIVVDCKYFIYTGVSKTARKGRPVPESMQEQALIETKSQE